MPELTLPTSSLDSLLEAAKSSHARQSVQLADVQALFVEDLSQVELELQRATHDGVVPATHAASHLLNAGGKRIRPLTVLLSASCFSVATAPVRELAVIAELVHLATLLHDDVLDDCLVRRGLPAARCVWGNAVSVLSGDLLLTHALERAARLEHRAVLPALITTLRRLVDGEVLQLRGRTRIDLSRETYFQIVRGKTASLFEWCAKTGALCSGARAEEANALGAYGRHLGTAFQLIDDALDYCGDVEQTGKALLTDLQEGKVTLPVIEALELEPGLACELEAWRNGDNEAAERIATAVARLRACVPVRALAQAETVRAQEALQRVPPSPARDLLRAVAAELTTRAG